MKYILLALMATILFPLGGHSQEQSVKILSITNGQQLLVEVEQHGRAVRLACLQAPRFREGTPGRRVVCSGRRDLPQAAQYSRRQC